MGPQENQLEPFDDLIKGQTWQDHTGWRLASFSFDEKENKEGCRVWLREISNMKIPCVASTITGIIQSSS